MKKIVKVKNVEIGNGVISVQTMLSKSIVNVKGTLNEIDGLKNAGCDIVRIALSDSEELCNFQKVCEKASLPIVADIQSNHDLALKAIEFGASKIRINPTYIGGIKEIKEVAHLANQRNIPIRVGVNMGSLEKNAEKTFGRTFEGLAYSAINSAKILEDCGFDNIVLSVKSSDVATMVKAVRLINEKSDYPQHIGVTEAGTLYTGIIKNAVGIGSLLLDNIGDTIRVSLSAPPIEEVRAGVRLLKSLSLRSGVKVISCPTCSRCDYDLFSLSKEIEDMTQNIQGDLKIAVMGCVVNGIGESMDADIGIVGVKNGFVVYKKGELYAKIGKEDYLSTFEKIVKDEINAKS